MDGESLVECRSTGQQTVVEPSVHPSGEHYYWEEKGNPAQVDGDELSSQVARLAAASTLAKWWPAKGSRHETALALSGMLLRAEWGEDETVKFVLAVAKAAGDDEWRAREANVRSTAKRLAEAKTVTGTAKLFNLIGEDVLNRVCEWLQIDAGSQPTISLDRIPSKIRGVVFDDSIKAFDKRRCISQIIQDEFRQNGRFLRTPDGRQFYFYEKERRLYEVTHGDFQNLLKDLSGLSSCEMYFRFVLDMISVDASRNAPLTDVHVLSHFDPDSGLLAVSDGGSGIWFRERRGEWERGNNGDNDLLFLTDSESTAWEPDFRGGGEALSWFINQHSFAQQPLSRQDQRALFEIWLLHQFFPRLRRTKLIPACLGPQGSGKSTMARTLGCLFVGANFELTGVNRDKEDAFVAAVTNRIVLGLDNADSRIPWLEDALARYATGERYRLRRLFSTNEEASYNSKAILLITSRDPQFNRPDVAERLLPLFFQRPEPRKTEEEIFSELEKRRGAIMGSLLTRLGEISDGLENIPVPRLAFRMADFASFGWRVFAQAKRETEWEDILDRLEKVQAGFASDGDGVILALAALMKKGEIKGVPVRDLFNQCHSIAEAEGFVIPDSAQAFGRQLSTLRRVIEIELDVKFRETRGHAGARRITLIRRNGDEGGDGDDK